VRIQLGWTASNGAEGYHVYSRYVPDNGAFTKSPEIAAPVTTTGIAWLYPGAWHFEFCISAYGGGMESGHGQACVIPPVYPGWSERRALPDTEKSTSALFEHNIVFYPDDPSSLVLVDNTTLSLQYNVTLLGNTEILVPNTTLSLPANFAFNTTVTLPDKPTLPVGDPEDLMPVNNNTLPFPIATK